MKIAIMGCGAIGTSIARAIDGGILPARLTHVYDSDADAAMRLASALKSPPEIVENFHLLSSQPLDMVVEAASQDAVREAALSVIQNKKDIMIMSAGALLDEPVLEILTDACRDHNRRIYLPSGAIAGLDAIKAARGSIESLDITTTKNPRSLAGAPFFSKAGIDPTGIGKRTTLFEGPASRAVEMFPANTNVSAVLALAAEMVPEVRVIADPDADKNTHRITAAGPFGTIQTTTQNVPDPGNPKTSRLAVLAAMETIRGLSHAVRIGT